MAGPSTSDLRQNARPLLLSRWLERAKANGRQTATGEGKREEGHARGGEEMPEAKDRGDRTGQDKGERLKVPHRPPKAPQGPARPGRAVPPALASCIVLCFLASSGSQNVFGLFGVLAGCAGAEALLLPFGRKDFFRTGENTVTTAPLGAARR